MLGYLFGFGCIISILFIVNSFVKINLKKNILKLIMPYLCIYSGIATIISKYYNPWSNNSVGAELIIRKGEDAVAIGYIFIIVGLLILYANYSVYFKKIFHNLLKK